MKKQIFLFSIFLLLFSCTKEIDRLDFTSLNTKEIDLLIEEDVQLELWTDFDGKSDQKFSFFYDIDYIQNNKIVATEELNTMKLKVKFVSIDIKIGKFNKMKIHTKLKSKISKLPSGVYTMRISPRIVGKIDNLKKYDLIIKQ